MQLICRDPDEGFERLHFVGNLILFGIYCQYFYIVRNDIYVQGVIHFCKLLSYSLLGINAPSALWKTDQKCQKYQDKSWQTE